MSSLFTEQMNLKPLRPRQATAIDSVRLAIKEGHKRIILQAPTGSGKTIIASHIIAGALDKGNRPMFCVPRLSLIGQTIKRFEAQGICDIGVIQGQHERTDFCAAVQVASIHTLVKRPLPEVDFAIIDEVHIQLKSLNKILDSEEWKGKVVIGLSATPWTKGMGLRWTKLIVLATTAEMINEGWLTPVIGYGVPDDFMPDVSQVHTNFDGEYVEGEAEKAMTTQKIVGNVVKTWLEKWGKDKTFMFCVNRNHAKKMQQEFQDAGVSCGYIDGTMDVHEREDVLRRYRTGEDRIIASIDTMGIGVDEDVRCIIYLRLTKSEMKWVQDGGRGIRLADGKESCLLLDHAGTAEELGLFTDIHHSALGTHDPQKKGEPATGNAPKPNKCPHCNLLVSRSADVCPFCFTKLHKGKSPREINAELVKIGSEKKQRLERSEEQAFYSGLIDFGQRRGFKPGWAANKFKERFGVWPRKLNAVPMTPRKAVKDFIAESAKRYRQEHKPEPQPVEEYQAEF
jgi:superfamily II DNA or RNA helicase